LQATSCLIIKTNPRHTFNALATFRSFYSRSIHNAFSSCSAQFSYHSSQEKKDAGSVKAAGAGS
jgi:hypothetical protein